MSTGICIYCKESKDSTLFNTEHVLPQSFGSFEPDNPTLDCVCKECNDYFGKDLDAVIARETIEGFERVFHGITPKENRRSARLRTTIAEEGPHKGMIGRLIPSKEDKKYSIDLAPQIGLYNKSSNAYEYFEIDDLPTTEKISSDYETKLKEVKYCINCDEDSARVLEALKKRGVNLKTRSEHPNEVPANPMMLTETKVTLDSTVMRGFAKIAFNYMAYHLGHQIALSDNFDFIREFIRYDLHMDKVADIFYPNQKPILQDDRLLEKMGHKGARFTQGHVVCIEREGDFISAQISLFNRNTYKIILCPRYDGILFEIRCGHLFDIETRRIQKLGSVSKSFVRQMYAHRTMRSRADRRPKRRH